MSANGLLAFSACFFLALVAADSITDDDIIYAVIEPTMQDTRGMNLVQQAYGFGFRPANRVARPFQTAKRNPQRPSFLDKVALLKLRGKSTIMDVIHGKGPY